MNKNSQVTLATLAEKLDVTTATVSKALRGKPGISKKMVKKVNSLARELNYQPNIAALNLKKQSTDSIGVLITRDIVNPWYAQLVSCISTELSKHGKTMILGLSKGSNEEERKCLDAFRGGRVDGIIVGPIFRRRSLENIWQSLNNGLPMVSFNCMDEMPVNYVAVDHSEGARLAVDYLIEMGHTRIGYLCCAPTDLQEMGKSRREGFERALFDHDLPLIGRDIYSGGDGKRGGYQAMRKLLEERKDDLPTAFFCHNDDIALGAMLAIQQAGLSVPEDFSLIGFDDIDEGRLSCPALTTVGNVKNELAQNLVEVILDVSKNKTASNLIKKEIVPELIIRETVKNIKKGVSQNGTNHLKNK